MKLSAEQIISKCVQGGAAQDIISGLQEDTPNIQSIRASLVRDIRRSGVSVNNSQVKVVGSVIEVLLEEGTVTSYMLSIANTYSEIYPEIDVFMRPKSV